MKKKIVVTVCCVSCFLFIILLMQSCFSDEYFPSKYPLKDGNEMVGIILPYYEEKAITIVKDYFPQATYNEIYRSNHHETGNHWLSSIDFNLNSNFCFEINLSDTIYFEFKAEFDKAEDFDKFKDKVFDFLYELDKTFVFNPYGDQQVYKDLYNEAYSEYLSNSRRGYAVNYYSKIDWVNYEISVWFDEKKGKFCVNINHNAFTSIDYYNSIIKTE